MAFNMLRSEEDGILSSFSLAQRRRIHSLLTSLVLSTDMAGHTAVVKSLEALVEKRQAEGATADFFSKPLFVEAAIIKS